MDDELAHGIFEFCTAEDQLWVDEDEYPNGAVVYLVLREDGISYSQSGSYSILMVP